MFIHRNTSSIPRTEANGSVSHRVIVAPDGRHFITYRSGPGGGATHMWSLATMELVRAFDRSMDGHIPVFDMVITPDGLRLVCVCMDGIIRVWSTSTGERICCIDGRSEPMYAVAVTPDGRYIIGSGQDCAVRIWRRGPILSEGGEHVELFRTCAVKHTNFVFSLAVTPDGEHVVSASIDGTVRVWLVKTGEEVRCFGGHGGPVYTVAVTPDGLRAVSGASRGEIFVWHLMTGEIETRIFARDSIVSIAVTSDGCYAVSVVENNTVCGWSLKTGEQVFALDASCPDMVAITPDDQCILSCAFPSTYTTDTTDTADTTRGGFSAVYCWCTPLYYARAELEDIHRLLSAANTAEEAEAATETTTAVADRGVDDSSLIEMVSLAFLVESARVIIMNAEAGLI